MAQSDHEAAVRLVTLYGVAVDSQRWDLFDQVFTPDIFADYSEPAIWRDLETFKRDFAVYHDPFDGTQHTMTSIVSDFDGDAGRVLTYGQWLLIRYAVHGGGCEWRGQGWYDDALVRTPGGWRIKQRRCRIISWSGNPEVNETTPGVKFALPTTSLRAEERSGDLGFLRGR
jgi:hypothetical protein